MFHLFCHQSGKLKGKYDFAFVKNGRYICGSNQGYERRGGVYKAIISIMDSVFSCSYLVYTTLIQDDTFKIPVVFKLNDDGVLMEIKGLKPKKKYTPSTTKPKYQPKKK